MSRPITVPGRFCGGNTRPDRIDAVLRRTRAARSAAGAGPPPVNIGPLSINVAVREAPLGQTQLILTRKEFDVLALLAAQDRVEVPFIVRMETGAVNWAVYQASILHDPLGEPEPDFTSRPAGWNGAAS